MRSETQVPEALLTPDDVSRLLGVSVNTLNAWRAQRKHLEFVRVGRLARYRVGEVQRFIEERTRSTGKAGKSA